VIYVGKAANLRTRVRTYLRGGDERSQVRFLCERLADFETIVTANDKEALILENNLIKQYRPRYNIRLKDDKSYVSVKVTVRDAWPRVLVTRRIVKDGSRYFGSTRSARSSRCARVATPCSATAAGRASSTTSSAASAPACSRSIAKRTRSTSAR
jgi:excinuclease ABC subunit C